jgi:hypothetical protein
MAALPWRRYGLPVWHVQAFETSVIGITAQ